LVLGEPDVLDVLDRCVHAMDREAAETPSTAS